MHKQTNKNLDLIMTLDLTSNLEETQKAEKNGDHHHTDAIREFQV